MIQIKQYRIHDTGYRLTDKGYRLNNIGYMILDNRWRIKIKEYRIKEYISLYKFVYPLCPTLAIYSIIHTLLDLLCNPIPLAIYSAIYI